jgi:nitrate reductase assembly molybdenum cofactor insertion protein NarJ/Pyruvate/2-oxoacid:ferredoxin oxidoreductase delta subunit
MLRSDLYHALAEALAEPPEAMAEPGPQWPLFATVAGLATASEAADRAALALAAVRAEPLAARRARYAALFAGAGRPRFQLYESEAVSGRVFGPQATEVERYYQAAGLEAAGAELPDHVSMELAFLAHTAEYGACDVERDFISKHAGRWLPGLGRALARSGDEVYAPIGQLLAEWVEECAEQRPPKGAPRAARLPRLPVMLQVEACTLCGFCVQVCPTRALAIHETARETALVLSAAKCVGCNKCERVCDQYALKMQPTAGERALSRGPSVLRQSPRARCHGCDEPMVSQAELDFVIRQIGHPAWLDYCSDCRSVLEASR